MKTFDLELTTGEGLDLPIGEKLALHHEIVLDICQQLAKRNGDKPLEYVELGVWRGRLAQIIAAGTRSRLMLVDRWAVPPADKLGQHQSADDRTSLKSQELYDGALLETRRRLHFASSRTAIIRSETDQAANCRAPGTVDFLLVDAGHYYGAVLADALAWWEKMAPGAIMAFHDYAGRYEGVQRAVKRFARKVCRPISILDGHLALIEAAPGCGLRFPQWHQRL